MMEEAVLTEAPCLKKRVSDLGQVRSQKRVWSSGATQKATNRLLERFRV